MTAQRVDNETQALKANIQKTVADTDLAHTQSAKTMTDAATSIATKNNLDAQTASIMAGLPLKKLENAAPEIINKFIEPIKQAVTPDFSAKGMLLPPPSASPYFQNLNKRLDEKWQKYKILTIKMKVKILCLLLLSLFMSPLLYVLQICSLTVLLMFTLTLSWLLR